MSSLAPGVGEHSAAVVRTEEALVASEELGSSGYAFADSPA